MIRRNFLPVVSVLACALSGVYHGALHAADVKQSQIASYRAPAGNIPATQHYNLNGIDAAVLPNGRLLTPAGVEVSLGAPKTYGMDLSPDGDSLITVQSGTRPFSATLVTGLLSKTPQTKLILLDSAFMGVAFSADGSRFFVAGGEDGVIWAGRTSTAAIEAIVNLNGASHAVTGPVDPTKRPSGVFKGTFPGALTLDRSTDYLYVVDQAAFQVHVIDTKQIDYQNASLLAANPNNFQAVVTRLATGRYPYSVALNADGSRLYVANVGLFQYKHLTPANPTGDPNKDYPLGYPGAGFPDETVNDRTITLQPVDPRNLPDSLQVPDTLRIGYINQQQQFVVPGLGDPNVPESMSVYSYQLRDPLVMSRGRGARAALSPSLLARTKTGLQVGEIENGIPSYGGSHPNAIAVSPTAIYVSNGFNDTVSVLDSSTFKEIGRISLTTLKGADAYLKGVQPVSLALSPDFQTLYVGEAGLSALAVVSVQGNGGTLEGMIPTGWWPSAIKVSEDGKSIYVANARGRGAPADPPIDARAGSISTVNIISAPSLADLPALTQRVQLNNGYFSGPPLPGNGPIPNLPGVPSNAIKHVIFINKENATFDLVLGDLVATRRAFPSTAFPPTRWASPPVPIIMSSRSASRWAITSSLSPPSPPMVTAG